MSRSDNPLRQSAGNSYDWWLGAYLSWAAAFVAGAVATLMMALNIGPLAWPWWAAVVLLVGGYVTSLIPLCMRTARLWVRKIATAGLVWTILATLWCGAMLGTVLLREPIRRIKQEIEVREAKAAERDRIRRHQESIARTETAEKLHAQRLARIRERDTELRRRFQMGDDGSPLPTIPTKVANYTGHQVATIPMQLEVPVLSFDQLDLKPQERAEELAGAPESVRDWQIRPLELEGTDLVPDVLWLDESRALLLTRAGKLLEFDAAAGKLTRQLDLGGPCAGFAQSKLAVVVARTNPGGLVWVDPTSLTAKRVTPVSKLLEVAANPAHDLVFVRTSIGPYALAAIHLPSNGLLTLLTPRESAHLGRDFDPPPTHASPASIDALSAASPMHLLARGGSSVYRWSIQNATLRFEESTSAGGHDEFATSQDGSFVLTPKGLFATRYLQASPTALQGEYRVPTAAVAGRSGVVFAAERNAGLQVFAPDGRMVNDYAWPAATTEGGIERVCLSPAETRLLVFGGKRTYLADVPSTLRNKFPWTLPVSGATWPSVEAPSLIVEDVQPRKSQRGPILPARRLVGGRGYWCWSADDTQLYRLHREFPPAPMNERDVLSRINAVTLKPEKAVSVPPEDGIAHLQMSQAGLVAIGEKSPVRLWVVDPDSLAVLRMIDAPELLPFTLRRSAVTAVPASPLAVVLTRDDHVMAIDLRSGRVAADLPLAKALGRPRLASSQIPLPPERSAVVLAPDGRHVFVLRDGLHRLHFGASGLEYQQSTPTELSVVAFRLSGDGRIALVSLRSRETIVFNSDNLEVPVNRDDRGGDLMDHAVLDHDGQCVWTADSYVHDLQLRVGIHCFPPDVISITKQYYLSTSGRTMLIGDHRHAFLVETQLVSDALGSLPRKE